MVRSVCSLVVWRMLRGSKLTGQRGWGNCDSNSERYERQGAANAQASQVSGDERTAPTCSCIATRRLRVQVGGTPEAGGQMRGERAPGPLLCVSRARLLGRCASAILQGNSGTDAVAKGSVASYGRPQLAFGTSNYRDPFR